MSVSCRMPIAPALGLVLMLSSSVQAQAPAQDAEGRTTLAAEGAGWLSVNTSDSSAAFSLTRLRSLEPGVWGFQLKGKSTEGTAALLTQGTLSPGFEGTAYFGGKLKGKAGKVVGVVKLGWSGERTTMIDPSSPFETQITKGVFHGWDASYVVSGPSKLGSWVGMFGFAAGARHAHNYGDLSEVTLENRKPIGTGTDGTERQTLSSVSGRTGTYAAGTGAIVDADYISQLAETRFAVRGFSRTMVGAGSAIDGTRIGADVSIFKDGGDFLKDRRLGLVVELTDVFRQGPEPGPVKDRLKVGLTVTLPFTGMH